MQFTLSFTLPNPLCLPLSHHHILQGMIYQTLQLQSEYSTFLHNHGYFNDNHNFKLFTFSMIQGNYRILNSNIIFYDHISIEVRSPLPDFCYIFMTAAAARGDWELNQSRILFESLTTTKKVITDSCITINMRSPLCISKTLVENGQKKPLYLQPSDCEFSDHIYHNFTNKYQAAYNIQPDEFISILPYKVSSKDKYVTRFKDIYITAWKGLYKLSAPSEILTFLYDAGLGSRNSQGFGLFDIYSSGKV